MGEWRVRRLEEICTRITDGSHFSPKVLSSGYPYITVRDIHDDAIDFEGCKFISQANYEELKRNGCCPEMGDVLYSKDGTVGKVSLVDFQRDFVVLSSLAIVRPNQDVIRPEYLRYAMKAPSFLRQAIAKKTGAAIRRIVLRDLGGIPVALPPLPEQERIVAILDETFAAIATATASAEKSLADARGLLNGRLDQVFGMPNPNWAEATVAELAKHSLGKMLDKRKSRGEFCPYLRNFNVRWFDFDLSDLFEMRFEESEHEKYSAEAGDLLICEGGYPGRAAIWLGPESIHFQKAIHRVRFHDSCHTGWFQYFLYYLDATGAIRKYFTGAGIQHLTGKSLAKVNLPIPPSEEVVAHVAGFDAFRTEADRLSEVYERKSVLLTELKQSVLHKAFTGELTADSNAADVALSKGEV